MVYSVNTAAVAAPQKLGRLSLSTEEKAIAAIALPPKKLGRPSLSTEEKAKRRSAAIIEAVARFEVSPDNALFRQPPVLAILGVSAATLWRWVKLYPVLQPTKLSDRVTVWSKRQIEAFMQSRMTAA